MSLLTCCFSWLHTHGPSPLTAASSFLYLFFLFSGLSSDPSFNLQVPPFSPHCPITGSTLYWPVNGEKIHTNHLSMWSAACLGARALEEAELTSKFKHPQDSPQHFHLGLMSAASCAPDQYSPALCTLRLHVLPIIQTGAGSDECNFYLHILKSELIKPPFICISSVNGGSIFFSLLPLLPLLHHLLFHSLPFSFPGTKRPT